MKKLLLASITVLLNLSFAWGTEVKLTALDGAGGDYFGVSVAISGDYAIVGRYFTSPSDPDPGAAYIYESITDLSLPVELSSFTAESQSTGVLLKWTTESEIENLGFVLERREKADKEKWTEIVSYKSNPALAGQGSTNERHEYQYLDKVVQPGVTYEYCLADVDYYGRITWHNPISITAAIMTVVVPTEFGLYKIYPNPFNPSTNLRYGIDHDGQTTLQVYNLQGQLIETLVNTYHAAGTYDFNWQPENISAGVYIVQLQSGNLSYRQKVAHVK
jgi:hypothetical protein